MPARAGSKFAARRHPRPTWSGRSGFSPQSGACGSPPPRAVFLRSTGLRRVLTLPIPARCRGLDDDRLACFERGGVAALQAFHAAVLATHPVLADLSGFAAGQPERRHAAVAGQDGAFHPLEKPDGAADPVAGVPLAAPAGPDADVKILKQHRIAELQHLRIGEARIRHVGVYRVGAGEAWSRRRARADRLVVLVARVAEIEVVHGALSC